KAKADYNTTVYAVAKTAIALFDGFIQCWYVKYKYNTARPETVINKYIDINWRPYLQTPAFPEYTCGHSTISSAAAEALTSVFGDNFSYTDSTEKEFGIANRSFRSFRHAAEENNWARFYGGLHFHNSCIVSTEIGRKVGTLIVDRLKMKK
ncbi:MAG: vanadium-dependent haloperoxidase, partial [Candidatus Magasanikbacteria bacterium]|nr:vanadium-dependent haloperoxidase [Candidatus Magasanikbacteria bacterium]